MKGSVRQLYRGLFGLQFRTTLLLTFVVLAATGLTGAIYLRISSRLTLAENKAHARDLAKTLAVAASPAIEANDKEVLTHLVSAVMSEGKLSYVIFTDVVGNMLACQQKGTGNITQFVLDEAARVSVEPINRPELTVREGVDPRVDIVYPVTESIASQGGPIHPATCGYVRLGLSLAAAETRLAAVIHDTIGLAVGITLLMVPLGFEVVRHIVRPINGLTRAAQAFAAGELDQRVDDKRRDEIGDLNRTFNAMADELESSHTKLVKLNAELEDRVLQRTTELEEANKRLAEMAARDSLTGLYNRRHFGNLLGQLFAEATRYNTELTCMMFDLDNFKRVNDTLGHQTGDQLLQMTARIIRETIRESDVAVRYGGDEFVILLPQTSPRDARSSAERLLEKFRKQLMEELPEANIATLSIGLASREEDRPEKAMDLVNLADEALYLAKAGGKNRITVLRPVGNSTTGDLC